MIPISAKTERLLEALYSSEQDRNHIRDVLVTQCGENIPFCERGTPESMERIRFAVLRLTTEKGDFGRWVKLAYIDWRDLFMSAGFGHDLDSHQQWADQILKIT